LQPDTASTALAFRATLLRLAQSGGRMDDRDRPIFSEDDFRAIERILTNGEEALDLRVELDLWAGDYARSYRLDHKKVRRQLAAIADAANALHGSLAVLDANTARGLAFELDVRHSTLLRKGSEAWRLLAQLKAASAALDADIRHIMKFHLPRRGRSENFNYWYLFDCVASIFQKRTGKAPTLTTSSLGDERGRGTTYAGGFFAVASIVDRAAAMAAGTRPKSATALGRWLKRFIATRASKNR
jgi:hypothetical protein